jgi:hypothetical protein
VLLHLQLLNCVQSLLSFWLGPILLQYTNTDFSTPEGRLDFSLRDLQSNDLSKGLIKYFLAQRTQFPSQASASYAIIALSSRPTSRTSVRRPSAGDGHLLPGSAIALCPFIRLTNAPYG